MITSISQKAFQKDMLAHFGQVLPAPMFRPRKSWSKVADALRNELGEYGEMLNLLFRQRTTMRNFDWGAVERFEEAILHQEILLQALRDHRIALAWTLVQAGEDCPKLRMMSPHFPQSMRPMIEALTAEVSQLALKQRSGRRQNRAVLARCRKAATQITETH